jgi:hypothetical protein
MKPKILEQEAKMNRFKYETYLKFYFKTHKKNESKRIASGYTKGIMLMQKTNYGALLPYQEDMSHPIPRLMIKDILKQNVAGQNFLKNLYYTKFIIRQSTNFRPLKILIEKEATNAKSL